VAGIIAAMTPTPSQAPAADAIDAFLDWQLTARHYPGAVVHIERQGHVIKTCAAGRLGPDSDEGMPADAVFRIASMTKPLVSVLALMLVEKGRLDLDEPVSLRLPELASPVLACGSPPSRLPTVRDLLCHTSGYAYAGEIRDPALRAAAVRANIDGQVPLLAPEQFLAALAALPLACEPGTAFHYGFSTDVLGLIIERVTGKRLGEALREALLEPLGMNETGFELWAGTEKRVARAFSEDKGCHAFSDTFALAQQRGMPLQSGGGGLVSTVPDYARFVRMLVNGGEVEGRRFLSEQSVQQMLSNQLEASNPGPVGFTGPGFGFGYGLAVRLDWGASATPSRTGEATWFGICGTVLWLQPRERWFALQFSANMRSRMLSRMEFRRSVQLLLDEA
jgi:CubicO group peptidase (beta-lactamase class C family)